MSWDTPHTDKPDKQWYHPQTLLWLLLDISYIMLNYIQEKYRSYRASRWALELQLTQAMQSSYFIAIDDSLSLTRRRDALKTMQKLKHMSEELDINNAHIDTYIHEYEELKHLLE